MKNTLAILLFFFPMVTGDACGQATPLPANGNKNYTDKNTDSMTAAFVIKVGDKEFTATLLDNPTAMALKAMLPFTINMTELNENEKYFRLPNNLPTNASNPGTINSGDLMLWGPNTLVLFYGTFVTSYSYTKVGRINNPAGLAAALGAGNVTVKMELQ